MNLAISRCTGWRARASVALLVLTSAVAQAGSKKSSKAPADGKEAAPSAATEGSGPTKVEKRTMPTVVGVLGGVVSRYDEAAKKFSLRVETRHLAGMVPPVNSKEMVRDLEVGL